MGVVAKTGHSTFAETTLSYGEKAPTTLLRRLASPVEPADNPAALSDLPSP